MESTSNSTKYVDIYKDAVNHRAEDRNLKVIIIDHNQLIDSLNNKCVEKNETYRVLHEKAKNDLIKVGRVSTDLTVQLVRNSINIALESMHKKWNLYAENKSTSQPKMINVVLTNFFDLALITGLINAKIKTTAIVELSCGKIAQIRDKFVSKASRDKQTNADNFIREFWHGFRNELDTSNGSSEFKNMIIYSYRSKYNAHCEPLDFDGIVDMTRNYVTREMNKVQEFIHNVKTGHENYIKKVNPAYALTTVDGGDDYTNDYKSYSERLNEYPEDAMTVAIVLDAMLKAVTVAKRDTTDWVDVHFNALKDESDDGCMNYPVCVQYGNECALTVRKHNLRFTDYSDSAVNVLKTRWKRQLWGSRPLMPLNAEAEYTETISDIKRLSKSDDVDVKLCVLALNRLRSNLDVYRGENIDLTALGMTAVTYKPELIEPAGCATTVQMLEKESEKYSKMGYAHFVPEDVMLVGFYDVQTGASTTPSKRSFDITVAQQPVHAKDYFDYFYGKKKPECSYAIDATGLCAHYREETEAVHFEDGDRLSVAKTQWRFERDAVCLRYKSKCWEIVRYVTDDDDEDRIRIYSDADRAEYCVEKHRDDVIRLTCKTPEDGGGVEIVSGKGRRNYVLRQWKADRGQKEAGRVYGDGRVVVESTDKTTAATYMANGLVRSVRTVDLKKNSQRFHGAGAGSLENFSKKIKTSESELRVQRSGSRVRRSLTAIVSNSSSKLASGNKWRSADETCGSFDRWTEAMTDYSEDGTTRTVWFYDGTRISTRVRQVPDEPGWVCYAIAGYRYEHAEYRTVEEHADGAFRVAGLVSRSSPDGRLRLRLAGRESGRMELGHDAVRAYRDRDHVATFGWNGAGGLPAFERRAGHHVTAVPLRSRVSHAGRAAACAAAATRSSFFVVKRCLSGFRALDGRERDEFFDEIRDRSGTAVRVRGDETVAVFVADVPVAAEKDGSDAEEDGGVAEDDGVAEETRDASYRWLTASRPSPEDVDVPASLVSRAFRKLDDRYGPVSDALRNVVGLGTPSSSTSSTLSSGPHERLVFRANVPNVDAVRAMYAAGPTAFPDDDGPADDSVATFARRAELLKAQRRKRAEDVLEARARTAADDFVPYFRCHDYDTLKTHLIAGGLPLDAVPASRAHEETNSSAR